MCCALGWVYLLSMKPIEVMIDERLRERYQRAYGATGGLDAELLDWADEGVWPD